MSLGRRAQAAKASLEASNVWRSENQVLCQGEALISKHRAKICLGSVCTESSTIADATSGPVQKHRR